MPNYQPDDTDERRYLVSNPMLSNVILTSQYGINVDGAEQLIREQSQPGAD